MSNLPNCPECDSKYTYEDGHMMVCPECAHEWIESDEEEEVAEGRMQSKIKDSNGNVLEDGDTITVIKDLKVKGSSNPIKIGTKVKNIKLIEGASDGHDIDCKIRGFGAMKLKSEFIKKA